MKTIKYTIIALLFIGFSSCTNDGKILKNRKADAAKAGTLVAEAATENFKTLKNMERFYAYNNEYLQILSGEDQLQANETLIANQQSDEVIETFRDMKKVFSSLELMYDKRFNKDNSGFKENVKAACKMLNIVHQDKKYKTKTEEIISTLDAKKFDAKVITYELCQLYAKVLDENIVLKRNQLETLYVAYAEKVKNIPEGTFSPQKLEQLVTEPVSSDKLLVEVYKLQLKNKAFQKKQIIESQFETIQKGMEELTLLYAEQLKSKKSKKEIDKLTHSILEKFAPTK